MKKTTMQMITMSVCKNAYPSNNWEYSDDWVKHIAEEGMDYSIWYNEKDWWYIIKMSGQNPYTVDNSMELMQELVHFYSCDKSE